eukprot:CAMPEP_0119123122 /NCGR_PEP_ID=MMETSP1310-20130426/3167_1 /TAXON_ID=464262 /ORGANISM="Genus nov. species nov., Strain RCC2339" /LENGTH=44 /DNA_ID= /DNA_START= /DNA_END= /DNA_ORIENTATION=
MESVPSKLGATSSQLPTRAEHGVVCSFCVTHTLAQLSAPNTTSS